MDTTLSAVLTGMGIVVGAALTLYQIRRAISPARLNLKNDLEVIKLARELELKDVAKEAAARIAYTRAGGLRDTWVRWIQANLPDPGELIAGGVIAILVFAGFFTWTVYLVKTGHTHWAILTGIMSFGGISPLMDAIDEQKRRAKPAPASEQNASPKPDLPVTTK
jgi:hypothetical protein